MELDGAATRRMEQELLASAQALQAAKRKAQALLDGIREAWNSKESDYVTAAVRKTIAELEREIERAELLAKETTQAGTRLRVEEELRREASFLQDGDGLF